MKKTYEMYISDFEKDRIDKGLNLNYATKIKRDSFKNKVTITIEEPEEKKLIKKLEVELPLYHQGREVGTRYRDVSNTEVSLKINELIDAVNQLYNKESKE